MVWAWCKYRTGTGMDTRWSKNRKEQMTRRRCRVVVMIGWYVVMEDRGSGHGPRMGRRSRPRVLFRGKGGCRILARGWWKGRSAWK